MANGRHSAHTAKGSGPQGRRRRLQRRRSSAIQISTSSIVQRARHDTSSLSPAEFNHLQRAVGNGAVGRVLSAGSGKRAQSTQPGEGIIEGAGIRRYPIQGNMVAGSRPRIQRGVLDAIGSFLKKGAKLVKNAVRFVKSRLFQACGGKIGSKESENILEQVFDGRKFKVDRVKVLDEAGIKKAWDDIYGEGSYDGSNGQPADGPLEGFTAPDNTIYINSSAQAVDTIPHEVLHRHENGAVIDNMGENFNEGFTEYLTQKAVKKMGYSPTSSYPDDLAIVKTMVPIIGGDTVLENAYFDGDLATLRKNLDKKKGKSTYKKLVKTMKAGNYAAAGKLLD